MARNAGSDAPCSKGPHDTLAMMAAKARAESASLAIDAPEDLARVRGFGGELNQVWANLIDNTLDAVNDEPHRSHNHNGGGGADER